MHLGLRQLASASRPSWSNRAHIIHSVSVVLCFRSALCSHLILDYNLRFSLFDLISCLRGTATAFVRFHWVSVCASQGLAVYSHAVHKLKNVVGEGGAEMSVRNLLNAEHVEHLVVGLGLHALELVDSDLAVVNCDEVEQLAVLIDVNIELLDGGGVGIDVLLDGGLRLEETLHCCLAHRHLLKLRLLVALLALSLGLKGLLVLAALHGTHH